MTAVDAPAARHQRFHALGTYAHLATTADLDAATALAQAVLRAVDRSCSRFRADSDLSRANRRAGRWTEVDPLLAAAVGVAVEAAEATAGAVDPCLGRSLVEIGYDADIATVRLRTTTDARPPAAPRPGAWREIGVDPHGAVLVPEGVQLDLGATAKAWASDLVAVTVAEELGGDVLVSLGGDVRVVGGGWTRWPVVVTEHPDGVCDDLPPQLVTITSGGLATSSTTVRRWTAAGVARHHLLDPTTGLPVVPVWRTVTATGPTCVAANVASTAAVVMAASAADWLEERGVDARLVSVTGHVVEVGRWPGPSPTGQGF